MTGAKHRCRKPPAAGIQNKMTKANLTQKYCQGKILKISQNNTRNPFQKLRQIISRVHKPWSAHCELWRLNIPSSRFAFHGLACPYFTVCALFFWALVHGLCTFSGRSLHLSRQPPSLPASQFTVCTSRFTPRQLSRNDFVIISINACKREQTQTSVNNRKIMELHPFLRTPFAAAQYKPVSGEIVL